MFQSKCDKYFTADDILDKVPGMFLLLGGVFTAFSVVATVLISTPRNLSNVKSNNHDLNDLNLGTNKDEDDSEDTKEEQEEKFSLNPFQILKTREFYMVIHCSKYFKL